MARKKDKPWWGLNDSLWGGETFDSTQTKAGLGIVAGDRFRVEKGRRTTLIPHPQNAGTWKQSHSKRKPILLTRYRARRIARAFKMMVKVTKNSKPKPMLLIERKNGTIAITDNFNNPGAGGGTASVER